MHGRIDLLRHATSSASTTRVVEAHFYFTFGMSAIYTTGTWLVPARPACYMFGTHLLHDCYMFGTHLLHACYMLGAWPALCIRYTQTMLEKLVN